MSTERKIHNGKPSKQHLANRLFDKGLSNAEVKLHLKAMGEEVTLGYVRKMRTEYTKQIKKEVVKAISSNPKVQELLEQPVDMKQRMARIQDLFLGYMEKAFDVGEIPKEQKTHASAIAADALLRMGGFK